MAKVKMSKEINRDRRRFFGTAAMTVAAAQFGMIGSAAAQSNMTKPADVPAVKPGTNTSFAPLKQIDAGVLSVGYAEAGPANGPVVILLHGWPYDIHSYVDVAPLLASAGYRVIVPYQRGFGTTRGFGNSGPTPNFNFLVCETAGRNTVIAASPVVAARNFRRVFMKSSANHDSRV